MESPAISTPTAFAQRVFQIGLPLEDVSLGSSRCVDGKGYEPRPMGGERDGALVPLLFARWD